MTKVLPEPEEVRAVFADYLAADPVKATDYLYGLGVEQNYIKIDSLAKSFRWTSDGPYGTLEYSINLTKPEKDPRDIIQAASTPMKVGGLAPQCDLCWENEGFPGTVDHPAKPGLRIAAITLAGERWGFQYSPYGYFPQHCIALSERHRPMKIDEGCFRRLIDFVDLFPHFFIGANADLPIVGGSILSHDHFQGGRHIFPLMKAAIERRVVLTDIPAVQAGIVSWPASVLRLSGQDGDAMVRAATRILTTWQTFDDEICGIVAHDLGPNPTPHNTLNPIVRKTDSGYVMDLVLRNNRTDPQHPWGIFHPDESLHHIKKENIGLIEIMGLAILPPRLATELPLIERELAEAAKQGFTPEVLGERLYKKKQTAKHRDWAVDIYVRKNRELLAESDRRTKNPEPNLLPTMQREVATVFTTILETTGVFKRDSVGRDGWSRFIKRLGQHCEND